MSKHPPTLALPPLLKMAVLNGVGAVIQQLIQGGYANARDNKGRTPLILAASKGHIEIARLLLESNADPTLTDLEGNNASTIARSHGFREFEALVSYYTPADREDNSAKTNTQQPTPDKSTDTNQPTEVELNDFELPDWKEELPPTNPTTNLSLVTKTTQTQQYINLYEPVNTDEGWLGEDVVLPEVETLSLWSYLNEDEKEERISAIRQLLVSGLRNGQIDGTRLRRITSTEKKPSEQNPLWPDSDEFETHDEALETELELLLEELGIEVGISERPEELEEWLQPTNEEDFWISETIACLNTPANNLLGVYEREISSIPLLTRDQEISLGQEAENGILGVLGVVAQSTEAMETFLSFARDVEKGKRALYSVVSRDQQLASEPDEDEEPTQTQEGRNCEEFIEKIKNIKRLLSAKTPTDKLRVELVGLQLTPEFLGELVNSLKKQYPNSTTSREAVANLETAKRAKRQLAEANLRLVIWAARRYSYSELPLLDLVQEGNLGLLKAVEKFDFRREAKFSTYAIWWIRQSISRAIQDKAKMIRIPVHLLEKQRKIQALIQQEYTKNSNLDVPQISQILSISEDVVAKILQIPDEPIDIDSNKNGVCLSEIISEANRQTQEDISIQISLAKALETILYKRLSEKQIEILDIRFGRKQKIELTLEEIGEQYNVTRERIRQIEMKSLEKLSKNEKIKELYEIYCKP